VVKCETDEKIHLFVTFGMLFYLMNEISLKDKSIHLMIGLDFEFNERKIALIQCAFFAENKNYIFICDPNKISTDTINIMIETIFTSNIYRIVHGSDSLDIPYIFEELFMKDSDKILKFTKTVIDTRYLCEYFKIVKETGDKKCSIYDAMLFFSTIDDKIHHRLTNINEIMGPVQDINWDIDRMDTYHLRYAAYDVYFLQFFLANMINRYYDDIKDRKDSIEYISPITRLVYLEKWDITKISAESKKIVDPMNNYYIRTKKGNLTLITIYNKLIENAFLEKLGIKITDILSINYYKSTLTYIFKRIIFFTIRVRFKVFINKNKWYGDRMTIDDIFGELKIIGSERISNIVSNFKQYVEDNLHIIFE
jgi:hypothetical protein